MASVRDENKPVQLVIWTHEPRNRPEDVLIDINLLPGAKEDDVAEIKTLTDKPKRLYFIVKKNNDPKIANVQLSVQSGLLNYLEILPRSTVEVRLRNPKEVRAETLEIIFKDSYLTRADIWRMAGSLVGKCIYTGQRLDYKDVFRTQASNMYRRGKRIFSAYVDADTKLVYRSASARCIFLIQMSSEMWNFEENGEVMFHKLVNSFLPEVFRRWRDDDAHHVVTIVLFSSIDLSHGKSKLGQGERGTEVRDFYRVVIDQVHISRWSHIMETLRYEFARFLREVLETKDGRIRGKVLPAVKGNIMEAITLATSLVSSKFNDRDLRRTNLEVIIVTPGSGIFDVDYNLFCQTSMKLLSIEISFDIVCLSRRPLHVTPLFRWLDSKTSRVINSVPSWLDISFWTSRESHSNQWIPKCKIYEIQMMGLMENDASAISIDFLPKPNADKRLEAIMDDYDDQIFISKQAISNQRMIYEAVTGDKSSSLLRPKITSVDMPKYAPSVHTARAVSVSTNQESASQTQTFNAGSSSQALLASTIKEPGLISKMSSLFKKGLSGGSGAGTNTNTTPPRSRVVSPSLSGLSENNFTPKIKPIDSNDDDKSAVTSVVSVLSGQSDSTVKPVSIAGGNAISIPSQKIQQLPDLSKLSGTHIFKSVAMDSIVNQNQNSARTSSMSIIGGGGRKAMPMINTDFAELSTSPRARQLQYSQLNKIAMATGSSPSGSAAWVKAGYRNEDLDANNHAWVTVSNPSRVGPNVVFNISNYGRWKNVFPIGVKKQNVKWRSIKSPAALPLSSSIFPSTEEFERNYVLKNYDITLDPDREDFMTPGNLLEEMVAMRLHIGFQIVMGDKVRDVEAHIGTSSNPDKIYQLLPDDYRLARFYMTRANEIHRLVCDITGTINVQLYSKNNMNYSEKTKKSPTYVKTKFDEAYHEVKGHYFDPSVRAVNWNSLDQILAGYEDTIKNERLFKVRFVLIPAEARTVSVSIEGGKSEKLTPEETRLEGLRRIINMLHRNSYLTRKEKELNNSNKKEILAPETKFYTGDLTVYLLQLLTGAPDSDSGLSKPDPLFLERLDRSVTLQQLANEMMSSKGIPLQDRRWHRKIHKRCFIGQQFVMWLVESFTDIDTAEEAVEYGNELMAKNFITHVEHRHSFMDGHYFYQLNSDYVPEDFKNETVTGSPSPLGWFGKKSSTNDSSPKTVSSSGDTASPMIPLHSASDQDRRRDLGSASASAAPSPPAFKLSEKSHKAYISRALKIDIDPQRRMKRHEYLTVHVDRVHNPQNAFHLRMEWLNCTPKLIEELVVNLGRIGDQYGLRLVQMPIEEIAVMPDGNPFCSMLRVKLCVEPGSDILKEPLKEDPQYYHKYWLQQLGFVTDMAAANTLIKGDIHIEYSWGAPFYNYNQYVHNSGTVIAQIVDDNDFLLMTNTLHVSRMRSNPTTTSNNATTTATATATGGSTSSTLGAHQQMVTKQQTPADVYGKLSLEDVVSSSSDPDEIHTNFIALCGDASKVENMYNVAVEAWSTRRQSETNTIAKT